MARTLGCYSNVVPLPGAADRRVLAGGFDQPDPDRAEQAWRVTQHSEPGLRHGEEPLHGEVEERAEPIIVTHPADGEPVSAEYYRIEPPGEWFENSKRRISGSRQRLAGLLLPSAREPLL